MSTPGTPTINALSRSLQMLEAVLVDREGRSVAAIAASLDMPIATAHRQVATLVADGFLARIPGRQLGPGARLLRLLELIDEKQIIAAAAVGKLSRLANKLDCVVQLGTLENEMVTYRLKTGPRADDLFTQVGLQLEAYCTGIGKVLLAYLPEAQREAYLATGPFPALTDRTITDPAQLRDELVCIASERVAFDHEETAEGLSCVAVPVVVPDGRVLAAISASRNSSSPGPFNLKELSQLMATAREIEVAIALAKANEGGSKGP